MTDRSRPQSVVDLLDRVDASWQEIDTAVACLHPEQLLAPLAGGWSAKDHLAHLAAWRRSLLALLEGRSRPEAIGLEPEQAARLGTDGINAALFERHQHRLLDEVLADLRDVHTRVRSALSTLTDEDLQRP